MKKLFSFFSTICLFFLAGFLAAISAFLFQVFLSRQLPPNSLFELFVFVFLEEALKFFFWRNSIFLTFPIINSYKKLFFFSFLFASGFWFLEIFFLKLKLTAWPLFSAIGILLAVHWLTTGLITSANYQLNKKNYTFSFLFFIFALLFHFVYNWLIAKNF